MNITLFGTGYVGLVTGTCFAEMGNHVLCVDIDPLKVDALKQGQIPIFEPGLEAMVASNTASGRLQFTTSAEQGIKHGRILFIAVGTPSDEDGSADLSHVLAVARTIATHMQEPKVVVDKSTVPVGTADQVRIEMNRTLAERHADIEFDVVSNPEFLKEGAAINDFMKPDRIIVGSENPASAALLDELYAPFNRNHDKLVHMDIRSAELTKYAANVMLAARISLMNEMANLADNLGADIEAVRRGIGSDPRIGFNFIYPGCGYGGSCFPKDVKALIHTAHSTGYEAEIIGSVEKVNEHQKGVLLNKLNHYFNDEIKGKTFALWGLAFKPNTDDMREAPSQTVMRQLWQQGAGIRAYDPAAMPEARKLFPEQLASGELVLCSARDETLEGSDGLIIVTEWNEFRSPDFEQVKQQLNTPVIFDGRNLYDPGHMQTAGFSYYGIGRGLR